MRINMNKISKNVHVKTHISKQFHNFSYQLKVSLISTSIVKVINEEAVSRKPLVEHLYYTQPSCDARATPYWNELPEEIVIASLVDFFQSVI